MNFRFVFSGESEIRCIKSIEEIRFTSILDLAVRRGDCCKHAIIVLLKVELANLALTSDRMAEEPGVPVGLGSHVVADILLRQRVSLAACVASDINVFHNAIKVDRQRNKVNREKDKFFSISHSTAN